ASMSGRPPWQNIWQGEGGHRHKDGSLRNHADGIASMDLFVVPTISFRLLYGFLILQHSRRQLLWLGVTARPSAHWIARQLTEAYGWQHAPHYIVRDRDCVYGEVVIHRLRAMGIRDRPISPRSPWQNGHSERLIGSIRRDCLDHVVVFGERHLRQLQRSSHTPIAAQGRAHSACRSDGGPHACDASSGRTAPPILQSVGFRQGQAFNRHLLEGRLLWRHGGDFGKPSGTKSGNPLA